MTVGRNGAIAVAGIIIVETVQTEVLIYLIVPRLLVLDQCRVGDVGRIKMGFPIGTAATIRTGRERSKHI